MCYAMKIFKFAAILGVLLVFLAGCGKEGPFGNNPGPKKPQWAN
jgi:hypothetical protein